MKFLVTGGAGFIGSNIVEELLAQGFKVRVLDNFSTGNRNNLISFWNDIEVIEGDIRYYPTVLRAVKGINVILHQAALPSVPRSISDPLTTHEVNTTGTLNVLQAATESGVDRFVFASSSSIYGEGTALSKSEDLIPLPKSPYAISKLTGEHYCRVYYQQFGLQTVVLRYFNVFGPRQSPYSDYAAVIPKFIKKISNNEQPEIYGDGTQTRDFTFVKNNVEANLVASFKTGIEGKVFNIACGESYSLNYLVQELNEIMQKQIKPIYLPPRVGDIKHSQANIDQAEKLLGYSPIIKLREGLIQTVNFFCLSYF